ncbi:MAG TPA: AAA family ATPase [Actinomycetota bacterium]|nr:AAA family ATPase [Actinomycetota bacterium]
MSQQQRPAWTGGSDEALVPLGRGDDAAPTTERDGQPADGAQPAEQARPPERTSPGQAPPADHARPAPEHAPADRYPPIDQRQRTGEGIPPGRGLPPPEASRDLVAGRPERADRAGRLAGVTSPASGRSTATAADFTAERYLRGQAAPPRDGWRRFVYWLTGGRINFGPSPAEQAERQLIARAKAPVAGCRSIAVISRKGGVGKTTTTLMLGHTFASLRGDRVVALDGNPDAGSLGYRVRRETAATVTNLLADEQEIIRYADIRSYTNQAPTRLEVVASDDDPRITTALGEEDYRRAIALLERHYNLILLDTGTGVLESATKGILQLAEQIVVVMSPSLDSARAASSTLDWLNENGHAELVRNAIAVVNAVREEGLVEVDKIEEHFQGRCRTVVRVPWDPHLSAGAETQVDRLRPVTRRAYLEVAAAVADGFTA